MKRACTVLAMAAFLSSNLVHAGVSSLSVAVNGMACPFCAFGVEKRLKTVNGVASVTVDMKTGKAMVTARPDMSIQYQKVPQAIKEAGFTAGEIQITADGYLEEEKNNQLIFHVNGLSLPLQPASTLKEQLGAALAAGKPVLLKGRIFLNKEQQWIFSPESIEEVTP